MQVKIISVDRGPQDDGSFGEDTRFGATYVTAWMCTVEVDGSALDKPVKIRVGAKSEGTSPPMAKYVVPGGIIIPNKQGLKEFRGKLEVYADSKATKEANGDSFQGGGGYSRGPSQSTGGGNTPPSGPYTYDELVALQLTCMEDAGRSFGEVYPDFGDTALQAAAATLFEQVTKFGIKLDQAIKQEPAMDEYAGAEEYDDTGEVDDSNLPF